MSRARFLDDILIDFIGGTFKEGLMVLKKTVLFLLHSTLSIGYGQL